jgi:hypothetical protein
MCDMCQGKYNRQHQTDFHRFKRPLIQFMPSEVQMSMKETDWYAERFIYPHLQRMANAGLSHEEIDGIIEKMAEIAKGERFLLGDYLAMAADAVVATSHYRASLFDTDGVQERLQAAGLTLKQQAKDGKV